jgi:hypothetical protein
MAWRTKKAVKKAKECALFWLKMLDIELWGDVEM